MLCCTSDGGDPSTDSDLCRRLGTSREARSDIEASEQSRHLTGVSQRPRMGGLEDLRRPLQRTRDRRRRPPNGATTRAHKGSGEGLVKGSERCISEMNALTSALM